MSIRFHLVSIVSAFVICFPLSSTAQSKNYCGTLSPNSDTAFAIKLISETIRKSSSFQAFVGKQPNIVIPIKFHIVRSTDGSDGNVTDPEIEELVYHINEAFAGNFGGHQTPFQFYISSIERHNNSTWYLSKRDTVEDDQMKQALHSGGHDALNVYTIKQPTDDPSTYGYGTFPWIFHKYFTHRDGVTIKSTVVSNQKDVVVHEIGHWLSLFHTFQDGCNNGNDHIDDTPAEASPNYDNDCPVPESRDSCPMMPGLDPTTNFMDYSFGCQTKFTLGQCERILSQYYAYREDSRRMAVWTGEPVYHQVPSTSFPIQVFVKKTRQRQLVTFSVLGLPTNATYSIPSISCSVKNNCEATLSISLPGNIVPGDYVLSITAKSFIGTSTTQTLLRVSPLFSGASVFYELPPEYQDFEVRPVVDNEGRLIVTTYAQFGSSRLLSISRTGLLNWGVESPRLTANGLVYSRSMRPIIGKDDQIFLTPYGSGSVYSFLANGQTAPGFPTDSNGGRFPEHTWAPLVANKNNGNIFVTTHHGVVSDTNLRVTSFNSSGTEQWRNEFVDLGNNTQAGTLVQGKAGDIYTFLFPESFPFQAECVRLNTLNGSVVSRVVTDKRVTEVAGDSEGMFVDNGHQAANMIYRIGSSCTVSEMYQAPDTMRVYFVGYQDGVVQTVFSFPPYNQNQTRIGLYFTNATTSEARYRQNFQVRPAKLYPPVDAVTDQFVYVIGFDTPQEDTLKLFKLKLEDLTTVASMDLSPYCAACEVSVSPTGTVYLTKINSPAKIYVVH